MKDHRIRFLNSTVVAGLVACVVCGEVHHPADVPKPAHADERMPEPSAIHFVLGTYASGTTFSSATPAGISVVWATEDKT